MEQLTNFHEQHETDGKHRPGRSPVGFIGDVIQKRTAPPVSPNEEDAYLIIATATGEFAGRENQIAYFRFGVWKYVVPFVSCRIWIANETLMYRWQGSKWIADLAAYPKSYIYGLQITWISVSQARIEIGACSGDAGEQIMRVNAPIVVDITVAGVNGLDTGVEAASTWYYVWLIKNLSTNAVAGLISASSTAPTLPAGYTVKRFLCAVRNNAASNFLNFEQCGEGPERTIFYREDIDSVLLVLSNGNATTFTPISLATLIPPTTRNAILSMRVNATDSWLRQTGTTPSTVHVYANSMLDLNMLTNSIQQVSYYVATPAGKFFLYVRGYCFKV